MRSEHVKRSRAVKISADDKARQNEYVKKYRPKRFVEDKAKHMST